MRFKLGELFSGPGGLALGAVKAKILRCGEEYSVEHAWANDYDANSCETYAQNICSGMSGGVVCCDVKDLDIEKLDPIDCFAYGFPCNDFSIVGERKGFSGKFGPLYSYGIEVLNYFKPRFFVAENVGGLASAGGGSAFSRILKDLENAGNGYNLTANLYKAEEYGVPQTRHRIIIVGIDRNENFTFKVPRPNFIDNYVSVGAAFSNPPIPDNIANHEKTAQSKVVVERLGYIKPGENVWTADLPEHLKLNVKGAKLSQIYKRLDPNKPSYTITGSGGGGTHGYHWSELRALTNRERARIQTFPDDFVFAGSKESVRKQIGMAVPPLLSETIFRAILSSFAGISYPSVSANIHEEPDLFSDLKECV